MSTPYADADNRRRRTGPMQSAQTGAAAMESARVESRWGLLRRGRFLALWAGQLTGVIGDSFNYIAVAWLVLQLTGSSVALGAILTSAAVPRALLILIGGAVNDRLSPRLALVLSRVVRAGVMGGLAAPAGRLRYAPRPLHRFVPDRRHFSVLHPRAAGASATRR